MAIVDWDRLERSTPHLGAGMAEHGMMGARTLSAALDIDTRQRGMDRSKMAGATSQGPSAMPP